MKKNRFTENKIIAILREADSGMPIAELTRKYGLGNSTIYNWRSKYAGMEASDLRELKRLKEENQRLKNLYAQASLENTILQEAIEGKL
jgi:putative transposase